MLPSDGRAVRRRKNKIHKEEKTMRILRKNFLKIATLGLIIAIVLAAKPGMPRMLYMASSIVGMTVGFAIAKIQVHMENRKEDAKKESEEK